MSINLCTGVSERIVMLSATKHPGPAREILRFAQDDKKKLGMIKAGLGWQTERVDSIDAY